MKTKITVAVVFVLTIVACGKDNFETKPQLRLRSVSPELVAIGGDLRMNIEYTDKEGDVSDSLIIVRQRLNRKSPVTRAPDPYDIPDFPTKDKGEFEVTLTYYTHLTVGMTPIPLPGNKKEIDTLRLKIVARDKGGNKSDTLFVDNVYVTR